MKKVKPIKFNFKKIGLIILSILVLLLIVAVVREAFNRRALDAEIARLNEDAENLKVEQDNLLTQLDHYESQFYLEKEARIKLNLKKAGEKVAIVKLTNNKNNADQGENDSPGNMILANWHQWSQYFFGVN